MDLYTVISIYVVGSKLKAYATPTKQLQPHALETPIILSSKWLAIGDLRCMDEALLILLIVIKYILLTKREGRTGRISARGLDSTDRAQRGPYKKDRGPIFSQYGPEQAWLIRDLLHDSNCLAERHK